MNMQRKIGLMLATLILAVCQLLPFMPGALPVLADADHSQVAETYGAVTPDLVKKYGMVPIYPQDIQEGTYDVPVNSSSAFFKITDCKLTVKDGQMTAVMTLSSQSYLLLYMESVEDFANRVALLFCDDPTIVEKLLGEESKPISSRTMHSRMKTLMRWALSEDYFTLRKRLHIDLKA